MDGCNDEVSRCDASGITAQVPQWNLQILTTIIKQETIESIDEEGTHSNGDMCPYKLSESSNTVNYYDQQLSMMEEVKKEYLEDECPETIRSIKSELITENEGKSKVTEPQEIEQVHVKEELSFVIKEEIDDDKNQLIPNLEMSEDRRILNNAGDTGLYYDVLITPQEIQPEICGGMYQNSFNSLTYNNEHVKAAPPTTVGNETTELHKCRCCDNFFYSYDHMLAHLSTVHSNGQPKLESYIDVIKRNHSGKNDQKYQCDSCERVYKSKGALVTHIKKIHYDYGRLFECFCGKQFRSPIYLNIHQYRRHGNCNKSNERFQCDSCQKIFTAKYYLVRHIKSIHYDYGRLFECWCGKRYSTPIRLYKHKNQQHGTGVRNTNVATNTEFQCDCCKKSFKKKKYLIAHMRNIHYDYGKLFECKCGKQFRTPAYLKIHEREQHNCVSNNEDKDINEGASRVLEIKEIKQEKSETTLPFIVKEEVVDKNTQFIVKTEALEEHRMLDNVGDRSVLYEVLITPQEIQPEMYSGMYQNSLNTLKHNNEYIKVVPPRRMDDKMNNFPKFVSNVRSNIKQSFKLNQEAIKPRNNGEMTHKCDSCERVYKSKTALLTHTKKIHYDYGRLFECFCGKQFRSPIHLHDHKYKQHNANTKTNETYQCDYCQKIFKTKGCLVRHIRSIHYDYGKLFKCSCGKQYRTPIRLYKHKNRQHGAKIRDTSNAVVKKQVQCDDYRPGAVNEKQQDRRSKYDNKDKFKCEYCESVFKVKRYLAYHVKRMHK